MNKIQFTSLKYYNSIISEECLYVGILFNDLTTKKRTFKTIQNFKRLATFDDEIDIDFVKLYLQGIQYEIENTLLNCRNEFQIEDYIRRYANEFRFSKITTVETDDIDFVENTSKLYLKFDYTKRHRLNKEEELRQIRTILKSANIKYSSEPINGYYNETIRYDYVVNDYLIKLFSFEDKKKISKMTSSARNWSFIADEVGDKYKTLFFYDTRLPDDPDYDVIIQILEKHAHRVFPIQEGLEFLITNHEKTA